MRVSVLVTPERHNIGNSFINKGALRLIEKTVPVGTEIFILEAFEITNNLFKYPEKLFTEVNKSIVDKSDVLVVCGGSCLSRFMLNFFKELTTVKIPKLLLGAGFYEGYKQETKLYDTLPEDFDFIFTRDKDSHTTLRQ